MKIKKIGHCCLVIKTKSATILTDPGSFTTDQNELTGIDIILITHEHEDHLHVPSVQSILAKNPQAQIVTNSAVGKQLEAAGIPFTVIEGHATGEVKGVALEAFDCKHEEIFEEMGIVQNTAYFVDGTFFIPGDAYCNPGKPVHILALPIADPWCRLPDAIRYAISVKPKMAFPIHDAVVIQEARGFMSMLLTTILKDRGNTDFIPLKEGDEADF